jgi:hypothetical protein
MMNAVKPVHRARAGRLPARQWLAGLCAALLLGAAGCATMSGQQRAQAEPLEVRVQAYWAARQANDAVTAFQFEEAAVIGAVDLQTYIRSRGALAYKHFEIRGIRQLSETEAVADLVVDYTLPAGGFRDAMRAEVEDRWRNLDGQWYHAVPERRGPSLRSAETN